MMNLFPPNPTHGMLFEQKNGVIYQYDASIKSWLKLATDNLKLTLATSGSNGAMSADDLKKLNRLVIPPPISSIKGESCTNPFLSGTIDLRSGDEFINVSGSVDIQNIDQYGDNISESYPFQIHQHTYGFDFKLDVQRLIKELEDRQKISLRGPAGERGDKGDKGDDGINGILSGPPGDRGNIGNAPECPYTVEPEVFDARAVPGLNKALVAARVVTDEIDPRKYKLEFDRQVVGQAAGVTSEFILEQAPSTWVLAITTLTDDSDSSVIETECGNPISSQSYQLYYIDIQPIVDSVHNRFLKEISLLKKGYENIVTFWVQTMSDLFDEQKRALCCALENCLSITKSNNLREHMESVAATALGKAKIKIHNRNSTEAVKLSSTRLLRLLDEKDVCKTEENDIPFPQMGGNPAASSMSLSMLDVDSNPNLANIFGSYTVELDNYDSKTYKRLVEAGVTNVISQGSEAIILSIDPLINSSINTAVKAELPQGRYNATIRHSTAAIDGQHRGNAKIRHILKGERHISSFLDKGSYESVVDAQNAYEGLALAFEHDGGDIQLFITSAQPREASGYVIIEISPSVNQHHTREVYSSGQQTGQEAFDENHIVVNSDQLSWYQEGWKTKNCCGFTLNLAGQQYIIIKRSINGDNACGDEILQVISPELSSYAICVPTFNGIDMIYDGQMRFTYDADFSKMIHDKINDREMLVDNGSERIDKILMPIS